MFSITFFSLNLFKFNKYNYYQDNTYTTTHCTVFRRSQTLIKKIKKKNNAMNAGLQFEEEQL